MGRLSPIDQNSLNHVCHQTEAVLKEVDEHNQKETAFFQEALERELGGEG